MSTDADRPSPFVVPRPGLASGLGLANIVIASLLLLGLLASIAWLVGVARMDEVQATLKPDANQAGAARPGEPPAIPEVGATTAPEATSPPSADAKAEPGPEPVQDGQVKVAGPPADPQVSVQVTTGPGAAGSSTTINYQYNPMMGMNEPTFVRFCIVDVATALILNGVMLASGIGLVNLRRWGASLWTWTAWIKIIRLVVLWGVFVIVVAPAVSESMARSVIGLFQSPQSGMPKGRMPSMADLTRVYSIMSFVLGVGMIAMGSIYPAATLWFVGRPGLKAALSDRGEAKPETTLP